MSKERVLLTEKDCVFHLVIAIRTLNFIFRNILKRNNNN